MRERARELLPQVLLTLLSLIQAMSTGHAGSMGTVHASGPEEAMWRLETLAVSAARAC